MGDDAAIKQMTGIDRNTFLSDPQNFNAYAYARNNPVKYVDPNGMFNVKTGEVEKGDTLSSITKILNKTNGTNYSVSTVQKLNNIEDRNIIKVGQILIPNESIPDVTQDLTSKMYTNASNPGILHPSFFKEQVQKGGSWDFKRQAGVYCTVTSCGGQKHGDYVFLGEKVDYDAPSNIHYGYVGSHTWYGSPTVLHHFANKAQNTDNNTSTGDTVSDKNYIDYGILLFNSGY
jgi:LysM repeat protein